MEGPELYSRLLACDRPQGDQDRTLILGGTPIRIVGLDAATAGDLERRWGGFLRSDAPPATSRTVRVLRAGKRGWLERWKPGELYRIESRNGPERRVVASYHFGLCADPESNGWRVALTEQDEEPVHRVVDNAFRYIAAELAVGSGGFAMHSAAVLSGGRAHIFAGSSGAGKTTAVGLCTPPAVSLGDDFGLVIPGENGWLTSALPFDNSERIVDAPPEGMFPVAGVWRLYKSPETRFERPAHGLAVASLMGCTAFPWAMPERAAELLTHVGSLVAAGLFGHLHLARTPGLLDRLAP